MGEVRARPQVGARARVPWLDAWLALVGAAILVRFALVGLLLSTGFTRHNGWFFPNDDQTQYYSFAEALTHGVVAPVYPTIGFDLFLVPFAATTEFVLQAIPPVAVLQMLLALPAAYLLFRLGCRLLSRRAAAVGTSLWLVLPLVGGPLFRPPVFGFWHDTSGVWLGFQLGADYISSLLGIAIAAAALTASGDGSARRGALLGVAAGYAVLVKPTNVIFLACALAALTLSRRWRAAMTALACAAVLFAPQLVLNHRYFGSVTSFAYDPAVARRLPTNLDILTRGSLSAGNLTRVYGTLFHHLAGGPAVLALVALGVAVAFVRFPRARLLVVLPVIGFGLVIGSYYYADGPHFPRLIVPALPLLCLALAGAALGGRPVEEAEAGRPRSSVLAVSGLGLAASLALAVWIGTAPAAGTDRVVEAAPVAAGLRPAVHESGGTVFIRWRAPDLPAEASYRVVRLRAPDPRAPTVRGFQWAPLEIERAIEVRGTVAEDRPGPGVWWYRVELAPSARPGGWPPSDVSVGISPSVRVVVAGG